MNAQQKVQVEMPYYLYVIIPHLQTMLADIAVQQN
jgi:hypothetical protein